MKYLRCKEEIEWWRKHLATKDTYLKNRCAGIRFDKIIKDLIKDNDSSDIPGNFFYSFYFIFNIYREFKLKI